MNFPYYECVTWPSIFGDVPFGGIQLHGFLEPNYLSSDGAAPQHTRKKKEKKCKKLVLQYTWLGRTTKTVFRVVVLSVNKIRECFGQFRSPIMLHVGTGFSLMRRQINELNWTLRMAVDVDEYNGKEHIIANLV